MASSVRSTLQLYKSMLREAAKFSDFNYRSYAIRRIRHGFREAKSISAPEEARSKLGEASSMLALIRRQAAIGAMFSPGHKLSIETMGSVKSK